MEDKITVGFYHSIIKGLKFKKQYEIFPYSKRKRNSIIDYILSKGLNVMVYQNKKNPNDIIIWIDEDSFKQR